MKLIKAAISLALILGSVPGWHGALTNSRRYTLRAANQYPSVEQKRDRGSGDDSTVAIGVRKGVGLAGYGSAAWS